MVRLVLGLGFRESRHCRWPLGVQFEFRLLLVAETLSDLDVQEVVPPQVSDAPVVVGPG
jgi:hypothetical protein